MNSTTPKNTRRDTHKSLKQISPNLKQQKTDFSLRKTFQKQKIEEKIFRIF